MTNVANDAAPDRFEEAGEWCTRLADGHLTPDEQKRFERWLAEHAENQKVFEQTVSVWNGFGAAATAPEAIALRTEALEAFRAANSRRWSAKGRRSFKWLAAAAAVLLAIMVPGGLWYSSWPDVYETGIGERQVAVLTDGSRVSLDADTQLEVKLRDDRRDIVLKQGRAKFDVAKDALRPFRVQVGEKIVVATGTSFSVELLNGAAHVVLYDGHVSVVSADADAPPAGLPRKRNAAEVDLSPGKELVASLDGGQQQVVPADLERTLTWEAGQLSFDDEPLTSAIARVNRYSEKKVVIADADLGKLPVSGVYNAGDVDAFAVGLEAVLPVRARDDGRTIALSSR